MLAALAGASTIKFTYADANVGAPWPLWQVDGLGGRAYLTAHTFPQRNPWRDVRLENLVPRCAAVWSETNHITSANSAQITAQYGFDANTKLLARLDAADQAKLRQVAAMAQVNLDHLATARPWLAASAIEETYYDTMHLSRQGLQQVLVAKAASLGIANPCEFATQDDVMRWFGGLNTVQDLQYLHYTQDHLLMGLDDNLRMCSDFGHGDFGRATAFVAGMKARYPDLFARICLARNLAWVPRFRTMLSARKPSLVILGFFHLVGPENVRDQLANAGFSVKQV